MPDLPEANASNIERIFVEVVPDEAGRRIAPMARNQVSVQFDSGIEILTDVFYDDDPADHFRRLADGMRHGTGTVNGKVSLEMPDAAGRRAVIAFASTQLQPDVYLKVEVYGNRSLDDLRHIAKAVS